MAARRPQLRGFDLRNLSEHVELIGVDEAGRGALAGPVVAAAVLVRREFLESRWAAHNAIRVNDSKELSAPEREALAFEFETLAVENAIRTGCGVAEVNEIEQLNILGATKLAMRRALECIYPPESFQQQVEPDLFASAEELEAWKGRVSCRVIIDGLPLKNFPYPHLGVVKGDGRSLCIAMASIIAKVTRDRLMTELDSRHPGYGFAHHKGYGTEEHREAVLRLGASPQHRGLFLRKLLAGRVDPDQMDFLAGNA